MCLGLRRYSVKVESSGHPGFFCNTISAGERQSVLVQGADVSCRFAHNQIMNKKTFSAVMGRCYALCWPLAKASPLLL